MFPKPSFKGPFSVSNPQPPVSCTSAVSSVAVLFLFVCRLLQIISLVFIAIMPPFVYCNYAALCLLQYAALCLLQLCRLVFIAIIPPCGFYNFAVLSCDCMCLFSFFSLLVPRKGCSVIVVCFGSYISILLRVLRSFIIFQNTLLYLQLLRVLDSRYLTYDFARPEAHGLMPWINGPRGYKTFFVLNSVEHEIFLLIKNYCWHFYIY